MKIVCNIVLQQPSPKAANVLVILNPMANSKGCDKMVITLCLKDIDI